MATSSKRTFAGKRGKKLRFEQLEQREMLAVNHWQWKVENITDDGSTSIASSLSGAIAQANGVFDSEHDDTHEIYFDLKLLNGNQTNTISMTGQLPVITASNVTIDGMDLTLTNFSDKRVVLLGDSTQNTVTSLRYDGSATTEGGHFFVHDLRFDTIEGDAIRIVGLGTNDRVTIDNVVALRSSPAFDVNGLPTLGTGSGVYFAATPSGALGRFEITDSFFYANQGAGIVIESALAPTPATATSLVARNFIGYEHVFGFVSGNGPTSPGIRIGSGGAKIDILSNGIYTPSLPGVQLTSAAGTGIRLGTDAQSTPNVFESATAYLSKGSPFDLLADGLPLANDQGDTDPGPNNLLNKPIVKQQDVRFAGDLWTVPFTVEFNVGGDYYFDFYRLDPTSKKWSLLKQFVRTVGAGMQTISDAPINAFEASMGDVIAIVATGKTVNVNSTSEFSNVVVLTDPPNVIDVSIVAANDPVGGESPVFYSQWLQGHQQYDPAPITNANRVRVHFSEHISSLVGSDGSALKLLKGPGQLVPLAANGFQYDSVNYIGTWTFAETLNDKYAIELESDLIVDESNLKLDGDWDHAISPLDMATKPDTIAHPPRNFPSGNGSAMGGDFRFHFAVRPPGSTVKHTATKATGDYDDNEGVTDVDYMVWKLTFGSTNDLRADGNGDLIVDAADYTPWRDNLTSYSAWSSGPAGSGGGSGIPVFDPLNVPRVANVTISSSLQTETWQLPHSFAEHDGSGEQLRTVPVGGADTISIAFTEDVNISADTLQLTGMRTANRPTLAEFRYDLGTMTATWRFTGWALGDQYLISLSDAVTDVEGNALDGEWTNPASLSTVNAAVSEFPSGNGYAGGDFNFVATLLPGDANLDLIVDGADYAIWSVLIGADGIFQDGEFDGDGLITGADGALWYQHSGYNLQNLSMLADLNGDWKVDNLDADILYNNYLLNLSNPTQSQGNLDGDADIDIHDLDLAFAQFGLELNVVS
jgi:hypothetical protein